MDYSVYGGLFLASFLAASVLPAQSEAMLLALAASGHYPVEMLFAVACFGNVLGSLVNWWLGRSIDRFRHRRWFPVKEKALDKAQEWYKRYGRWCLLLSWMPVIGDPMTIAAGMLRERLFIFIPLVTIGKAVRYLVVVSLA